MGRLKVTIVEIVGDSVHQVEVYEADKASDAVKSVVESVGVSGDCWMIGVGDSVIAIVVENEKPHI